MDKNKYSYFIDQCNKTLLASEWISIFGPITIETIKEFHYKIKNPKNGYEAIEFVETHLENYLKNKYLSKFPKYFDKAYKDLFRQGLIPNSIDQIITELLNDNHFKLLVLQARKKLGIPIETGRKLKDPDIHREYDLNEKEGNAVMELMIYSALFGNTWYKFFIYLLIFNYLMPVVYLEIEELSTMIESKTFNKLLTQLLKRIKFKNMYKRQTNFIYQLEKLNNQSKNIKNDVLKKLYPYDFESGNLALKIFETTKKRTNRANNRKKDQLQTLIERARKITPNPPKIDF